MSGGWSLTLSIFSTISSDDFLTVREPDVDRRPQALNMLKIDPAELWAGVSHRFDECIRIFPELFDYRRTCGGPITIGTAQMMGLGISASRDVSQ